MINQKIYENLRNSGQEYRPAHETLKMKTCFILEKQLHTLVENKTGTTVEIRTCGGYGIKQL
jgi:hypothetical protein